MIFAVLPKYQKKEVSTFCFKLCGKLRVASIETGEYGQAGACSHDDCEHEVDRTDVFGLAFGEPVCFRKLTELK